jgi:hypothetical protein
MEFLSGRERETGDAPEGQSPKRRTLLALLTAIGLSTGCSFHRAADRSGEPDHPPHPPPQRRDQLPTIGTDPSTVPAGQTIPPTGLGMDLM